MSLRYTLGLDQFLSRHGPSCFVADLSLVHSSYDNLLHFAKAVPRIDSTPSGFDLSEESRGWVDRLDGVVFVWRELFRDDESRILFVPFLSFDLVASDYVFLQVWKERSRMFPGGPTPPVFPESGVSLPAVVPPPPSAATQPPPSSPFRSRGSGRGSRRGSRRGRGAPSDFSEWSESLGPDDFDVERAAPLSGPARESAEQATLRHLENSEWERMRPGFQCGNCKKHDLPCHASFRFARRCDNCADRRLKCSPGPHIPAPRNFAIVPLDGASTSVPLVGVGRASSPSSSDILTTLRSRGYRASYLLNLPVRAPSSSPPS